jgi:SAM-dependent methyltransferase
MAPTADVRECPATALAFEDAMFDCVTVFDVLEHIVDLDVAVAEIARVLRPGGRLVATVPVYDGPLGWVVRALDRDPTHVHKTARGAWKTGPLCTRFVLNDWEGAWRYFIGGRYWHVRARVGRSVAPAIVMAWERR